jgi:hypothetical protein
MTGERHPPDEARDYYAARVRDADDRSEHLVVVPANDELDARRESGLIDAEFHLADDAELDEWDEVCARPLTEADLRSLLKAVRKEQVGMANRFARDRGFGSSPVAEARRHKKARKLTELRGKLEQMLEDVWNGDDGVDADAEPFIEETA